MIKPETIQRILETAHIEEVIGDFVTLKKRGANYLGLCPFHNEKTPSFSVSPSKGIYKCFGCGKAGNVVGFIMEHEHYSYPEALKFLAKKYNIEIEEEELTPEMQQELDERESMFTANSFVSKYFQHNLTETEEGKSVALSYLKERDLRDATIEKFELGYALDKWQDYSEHAIKNGFKKEILAKVGLSIEKEDRLIDRFRGRVIFPIHNLTGKVIGFGGRILSSEKSTAKYINSPESDIYNKSKVLYGIYFARNEIVKKNNCYLVEGYTDVISLHQAGIENVVASSGTSLTEDQIRLIKRFTPNITILYDGDTAGIKASFRGIDLILEQGMNVKIVLFPDGEDPDSYVRSHRTSEVEEFITGQAKDFITFKTNLLLDETLGDPARKAELIKEIVESISRIPNGINRSVYIKECSIMLDVPEQTLMNELNKRLKQRFKKQTSPGYAEPQTEETEVKQSLEQQLEVDPLDLTSNERFLVEIILKYGNSTITYEEEGVKKEITLTDYILEDIRNDQIEFNDLLVKEVFQEVLEFRSSGKEVNDKYFISHPKQKISNFAIELIASPYMLSDGWEKNKIYVKTFTDDLGDSSTKVLLWIKLKSLRREGKLLLEQMRDADSEDMILLQKKYMAISELVKHIADELGTVIS
jgi:DNA primase